MMIRAAGLLRAALAIAVVVMTYWLTHEPPPPLGLPAWSAWMFYLTCAAILLGEATGWVMPRWWPWVAGAAALQGRGGAREDLAAASVSEALDCAAALLAARTCVGPRLVGVPTTFDHDGLWRAAAHRPLAALIYTASQHGDSDAAAWLAQVSTQLSCEDADPGWVAAVHAVAEVDSGLSAWVEAASRMERRQRASLAVVMRDAIAEQAGVAR